MTTEPQPFPTPEPVPDADMSRSAETMPDHTQSVGMDEEPAKPRRGARGKPIRLGQNKKLRSGIRKLTDADREKMANWYTGLALLLAPINRKASQATALSTDQCVDAWFELADQNDRVRAFILGILEGGAWGALIGAHMPILYAAIPDDMWARMPGLVNLKPQETETEL